jgi:serine/threonine protein kinase
MASSSSQFTPRDKLPTVVHNLGEETAAGPQDNTVTKADVIPTRLAHYKVQHKLGQGGMGWVLLAEDTKLNRKVALKVMRGRLAKEKESRERFLREATAAAALRHDNVITIYQVDEDRGVPFFAMELLEGGTLQQRLEYPKPLSIGAAVRIAREIAQGLQVAHERGVIHRDIKPANIWLESPRGRVKILDFGLARQVDVKSGLTHVGEIVGTPHYMSPEQARGRAIDARTDLFSLGCVLYRMTTGKLPFAGETLLATLTAIAVEAPTPVIEHNPQVPHPLADLIERLLAKDPAARPASAREVIDDLTAIERDLAPANRSGFSIDVPPAIHVQTRPKMAAAATTSAQSAAPAAPAAVARSTAKAPSRPIAVGTMRWLWLIALSVGAVAVPAVIVFAVWLAANITSQSHERPAGQPRPELPDLRVVIPLSSSAEASKAAAEWTFAKGGPLSSVQVRLEGESNTIKITRAADLPADPYTLVAVELGGSQSLTDSDLKALSGVTTLSAVDLSETPITDVGLARLENLPALTQLRLARTSVTDAGLTRMVSTSPMLRRICIGESACTAGVLPALQELAQLEELSLSGLPIDDAHLVQIAAIQGLKTLDLQGTKITDAGLRELTRMPYLTHLVLDDTRVGDQGLATIAGRRLLETLKINSTQLTDGGLGRLKQLPSLKHLEIRDNDKLTDAGLWALAEVRSLERLVVTTGQFSTGATEYLRRKLPNLQLKLLEPIAQ